MRRGAQVLAIARWEFLRYFKVRDVIISVLLIAGLGGASKLFSWWQARSRSTVEIAVVSPVAVAPRAGRVVLAPHPASELPALRAAVAAGELAGVLIIEPPSVRLLVNDEPPWRDDVTAAASEALQSARLAELGITPEQLAVALAPATVELELLRGSARPRAAKAAAALLVALMLATLLFGLAYLFMGITGEKQQRVSEQVFVMTSGQALIDGKLLGLGLLALVVTAQTVVVGAVGWEVFSGGVFAWAGRALGGVGAGTLVALVAFAAAGFAFWFTLSAAWFATISDPNSSARSNALLLPFLPLSAVFIGLSDPDSAMMRVLAFLPITSMTVVPARLVLTDVSLIEISLSLALLIAATLWLRRAAARVYEAAMLMYGKEPSLREMRRWLRAPSG